VRVFELKVVVVAAAAAAVVVVVVVVIRITRKILRNKFKRHLFTKARLNRSVFTLGSHGPFL